MFDKDQAVGLLDDVVAGIGQALAELDLIRKEGGEIAQLKKKRKAVRTTLEGLQEQLARLSDLVNEADSAPGPGPNPGPDPVPDPDPVADPVPDPIPDPVPDPDPVHLIPLPEQHAVSKLMQDTAVHLAARRKKNEWEIRHRNLPGGANSEAIRKKSIAECYSVYEQQAKRPGNFQPFEPRALSLDEQQALVDLWNIENDKPRSVRWERGATLVDYVLPNGSHGSSKHDGVTFEASQLIGPVGHLKAKLG